MPGLWVRASPGASHFFNCKKNLSPRPGIEPGPSTWQAEILTTRLSRNWCRRLVGSWSNTDVMSCDPDKQKVYLSQLVGFEPTLPEGNWFRVSRLNHSATTANLLVWVDEKLLCQHPSIVGSVVECSPATRAARVRFPDDAVYFFHF